MTGVISAAFSRTGAVFVALLVLCGFGYVSYLDIPKEATPDVDIPVAYVSVGYEGISPEDSERLLVKPLEKHLRSVQGLDKMSSVASEGYASVSLEFDAGEDIDRILDDVRQAVDDAKPDLPGEADEPKVTEVNLSLFPILTAALCCGTGIGLRNWIVDVLQGAHHAVPARKGEGRHGPPTGAHHPRDCPHRHAKQRAKAG